jgi:hypothetical protein
VSTLRPRLASLSAQECVEQPGIGVGIQFCHGHLSLAYTLPLALTLLGWPCRDCGGEREGTFADRDGQASDGQGTRAVWAMGQR